MRTAQSWASWSPFQKAQLKRKSLFELAEFWRFEPFNEIRLATLSRFEEMETTRDAWRW